jgi:hypothetical protein
MTPEIKKALDLALEALEPFSTPNWAGAGVDKANAAITAIRKARSAPVQEPVAHCEAGPEYCQQCHLEDRSLALAAAVRYVKNNTPKLVSDEICMALSTPPAAQQEPVGEIGWGGSVNWHKTIPEFGTELYTTKPAAQRTWVGLTEQEAAECWSTSTVRTWQAIEAKLKEKNHG